MIDDGSRDQTLQTVQAYIQKKKDVFQRFRIYSQKNQGPGAARNLGIRNADGNWISFLDSDDVWKPEKLECVTRIIASHPDVTMVSHEMYDVSENQIPGREDTGRMEKSKMHTRFQKDQPLFVQLYRANFLATSCLTIRKEALTMAGGFRSCIGYAEDYDLWLRIARTGRLYLSERALGYYITRKGNISSDIFQRYVWEMEICRKYIPKLYEYMDGIQVKRIVRNRVLRIHLANMKAACKNRRFHDLFRIGCRLPYQICRMRGYFKN